MRVAGIIPARFASTRFPGKPLALIHGVSMIERVYKSTSMAGSLASVVVATDDERIFNHVQSFGGHVVMTSPDHASGTDRCAEAALKLEGYFDAILNVQGDEPYIQPGQIDLLVSCFMDQETRIATLVKQITDPADLRNVNIPKVVLNHKGRALYFSRNQIPYAKSAEISNLIENKAFFRHIGIYGFRREALMEVAQLKRGMLENCESLEQLCWLEAGYAIQTAVSEHENYAVDIPEDVKRIEKIFPAD